MNHSCSGSPPTPQSGPAMVNYSELPGLDGVYLEDSFVLGIGETSDELVFDLDALLTPSHPSYAPPNRGERFLLTVT